MIAPSPSVCTRCFVDVLPMAEARGLRCGFGRPFDIDLFIKTCACTRN